MGTHHTHQIGMVIMHHKHTCHVSKLSEYSSAIYVDTHDKSRDETAWGMPTEVRIVPSKMGLVVVMYFDQREDSRIVFTAQIDSKYGAWQNLKWDPDFHRKWSKKRVKEAINNFLMVAEKERRKAIH